MPDQFSRTALLLGGEAVEILRRSRVAVFGMGGVGGYVVEALARGGVGTLDLTDSDTICLSNLNRQIFATHQTLGLYKVDAAARRVRDINPAAVVHAHRCFFLPETSGLFDFGAYDYVVDAIDTVTGKIELILKAKAAGVPVISAMGAGNKLDPTAFRVADIYDTKVCPLARIMRAELKKRGVERLKVVYSEEPPVRPSGGGGARSGEANGDGVDNGATDACPDHALASETADPVRAPLSGAADPVRALPSEAVHPGRALASETADPVRALPSETVHPGRALASEAADLDRALTSEAARTRVLPGSVPFVPPVVGLIIAGEVIKDLTAQAPPRR